MHAYASEELPIPTHQRRRGIIGMLRVRFETIYTVNEYSGNARLHM